MFTKTGEVKIRMGNKRQIGVGVWLTGAITAVLCVRFSAAYATYAMVLFALVLLYLWRKNGNLKNLDFKDSATRTFLLGFGCFYGVLFLLALFSADWLSVRQTGSYMMLAFPFLMIYTLCRLTQSGDGVKWGLLLGGLVIVFNAFWQWHTSGAARICSFFAHPNHLGTYCALLIPFAGFFAYRAERRWETFAWSFFAILLFACLWMTGSRGAALAWMGGMLCAGGTVLLCKKGVLKRKNVLFWVCPLLLVVMIGIGFTAAFTANRGAKATIMNSGGERFLMWQASLDIWEDHKLTGVGLAHWEDAYYGVEYHPDKAREEGHNMPHNMLLYFLSTTGIIGLFGYVTFLFFSFRSLWKSMKKGADCLFSLVTLSAFFAFMMQGLVDTTIINTIPSRIYFALMGYYLACYHLNENKESN